MQRGTEAVDELRISERFGRNRDDLEAHAERRGSYEVLEERAGAVETRQQDDTPRAPRVIWGFAFANANAPI